MNPQLIATLIIYLIKVVLIVLVMVLPAVALSVWLERRLVGRIQQRPGPNRVGIGKWRLFGLGQGLLADPVKLMLKENCQPKLDHPILHSLAPAITVAPAMLVISIIPMGPVIGMFFDGIDMSGVTQFSVVDLPTLGILFYLAMTGIGLYGIVLAGWCSNSKYSLLGGIRSSAQMLSYELAMGLSIIGLLLIAGSVSLREIVAQQDGGFWNWFIVRQPVGFMLFLIAGFAETNRLPFDLAEGESELGGGFHTEYGSMKFATFFMTEYMNMIGFSAILATMFLGGFHGPIGAFDDLAAGKILTPIIAGIGGFAGGLFPEAWRVLSWDYGSIASVAVGVIWLGIKVFLMMCFYITVRGTLPRLRYDQLMNFGWKVMFPFALINMVITAGVMAFAPKMTGAAVSTSGVFTAILFIVGLAQLAGFDMFMNARKRRLLGHVS